MTQHKKNILLEPYKLSDKILLKNRILMAPMTRGMADKEHTPTDIMQDYYARRANAGLIITEATLISLDALGHGNVPGIYSEKQIEKWSQITQKVHHNNGLIFSQLWHNGRVSHPSFHQGRLPISPSAIPLHIKLGSTGLIAESSREASLDEIQALVATYVQAAKNARTAGFDGVEIHGSHGYLVDQFLHCCSNKRTDRYGGTPENRARFCLEVVQACGEAIGFERVGLRLSPGGYLNEIYNEPGDQQVYQYLFDQLNQYSIAYVHTGTADDALSYEGLNNQTMTGFMRPYYHGTLIAAGGYSIQSAEEGIKNKQFDLIALGRPFIANPTLVDHLVNESPLKAFTPELLDRPLY
jgi:N-ethylmaleimide reductase